MSFALANTLRQKGVALATLLVWLVALHTCLAGNAGLMASSCETLGDAAGGHCHGGESHERQDRDAPQNHQENEDCCDELAVAWSYNERFSTVSAVLLADGGPETACAFSFPTQDAGEASSPAIWSPGASFFTSKVVGSSLFGRAPPAIG